MIYLAIMLAEVATGPLIPQAWGGEVYYCWKRLTAGPLCAGCSGWACIAGPPCFDSKVCETLAYGEAVAKGQHMGIDSARPCWRKYGCIYAGPTGCMQGPIVFEESLETAVQPIFFGSCGPPD